MSLRPWQLPVGPGGPPEAPAMTKQNKSARNKPFLIYFLLIEVHQPGLLERALSTAYFVMV